MTCPQITRRLAYRLEPFHKRQQRSPPNPTPHRGKTRATRMRITEIIFWSCTASVIYAYGIYPLLISHCARLFGRNRQPPGLRDTECPRVSLLIAAHNEQDVIEDRIYNALEMDYPRGKLEVVIASD